MTITEKQLAQSSGDLTTATSVYSPSSGTGVITQITIVETTGTPGTPTVTIYHDDDGTTYDRTTEIFGDFAMANDETKNFFGKWTVDSSGNFAVKSSVASSITVTLYGYEVT